MGAATDLPLTRSGQAQAEALAQYLLDQKTDVSAIFAGPLLRQRQTAEAIARRFSLPIQEEPCLSEIDYGPWEGLRACEIASRWPEAYRAWTQEGHWATGIFGGTLKDRLNSIEKWLERLKTSYPKDSTLIAVGSNGIIRFFHPRIPKGEMEKLKVKTGHFCELLIYSGGVEVKSWNTTPHSL